MEVLDLTKHFDDPNCALFISEPGFAISFHLRLSDGDTEKNLTELIWSHGGRVEKEYKDMKCRTILLVDSNTYRPQLFDRIPFGANYVTDCVIKNTLLQLAPYAFRTTVTEPRENFMDVIFFRTREFKILNHDDPVECNDQFKTYTIISTPDSLFKVPYNISTSTSKQMRKDPSKINSPKQLASTSIHHSTTKENSEPKLYLQKKVKIKIITNEDDEESEDANSHPKQVDRSNLDKNDKKIKAKPSNFVIEEKKNSSSESSSEHNSGSNQRKATTKELAPTDMKSIRKVISSLDDSPEMILPIKSPQKIKLSGKEIKMTRSPRNQPSTSKAAVEALSDSDESSANPQRKENSRFTNENEGKTKSTNKKAAKIVQLSNETNSDSDESSVNPGKNYPKLDLNSKPRVALEQLSIDEEYDSFGPKPAYWTRQQSPAPHQPNYNTRDPYTRREKEIILKYTLQKRKLHGLRSNVIWKEMERERVLPKRTWQSLKNHFLKTLVNELDKFRFLTESEKKLLKK